MNAKQIKAVELMVLTDMTQTQIAEEIGVHRNTIGNWLNNDEFTAARDKYVRQQLDASVGKALRTMVDLLDAEAPGVRYSAARDILDRTGYKATDKVEHTGPPVTITDARSRLLEKLQKQGA